MAQAEIHPNGLAGAGRRVERLALAHSGSGQQRRYAARERLPSGRLGHRSRSKRAAPESRVREDITGRPDADLLPLAYDSKPVNAYCTLGSRLGRT